MLSRRGSNEALNKLRQDNPGTDHAVTHVHIYTHPSFQAARTGLDRVGQDKTGQDRTGQYRAGQDRTGQVRKVQAKDRTGPASCCHRSQDTSTDC